MKIKYIYFILLVAVISSCNKDKKNSETGPLVTESEKQSVSIVLDVERTINELEFIARSIKTSYPNQPGILTGAIITQGLTNEGKTKYDILFSGIASSDGKIRTGKITVVSEDAVENGNVVIGKHLHVRADNDDQLYSVNGLKFKGSLIFSNVAGAKNSTSVPISHLTVQSSLFKNNGDQIRFSSSRKSYWVTGNTTATWDDDGFVIKDQDYSLDLISNTTAFIRASGLSESTLNMQCNNDLFTPKKGNLKVEHIGGKTYSLNLGTGKCDDLAEIKIYE